MSASFNIVEFMENPTLEKLTACQLRKSDWVSLANEYKIGVKQYWKKVRVKNEVLQNLVSLEILDSEALDLCEEVPGEVDPEVRKLELELEQKKLLLKEKEIEQMKLLKEEEMNMKEREFAMEQERMDFERERLAYEEREKEKEREEKEK